MTEQEAEWQDVLIADDDKDDFEMLAQAIEELSLKVMLSRAENGDMLLKIIHEKIPDLLFLDIVMPCKGGKDCITEIRSDKKFDNLPIIVYTSVRDLSTIEFCYRSGTNFYVIKPDTYGEIVDVIRKIFAVNWKKMKYYPTRNDYVLNYDTPRRMF